jgi:hypothetical protein
MHTASRLLVGLVLAVAASGCSLLYPFDLPDAEDGEGGLDSEVHDDGETGEDGDAEVPSTCGNGTTEPPEQCDGDVPRSCTTSCSTTGTQACVDCSWTACEPPAESCNGIDDDCDTAIDQGYPCAAGATVACTTPCGVTGSGVCSEMCELPTRAACAAATEACNGCDDTRDGTTDEGCACATGWAVEHPLAPGPESLYGIGAAQDGSGWAFAVGGGGTILQYDGMQWTRSTPVGTDTIRWVDVLRRDFAVAAGQSGSVYWWNGSTWRYDDTSGTSTMLYAIDAVSETDVWAVGANGTSVHWDGTRWQVVSTGTTRHLYGVLAVAADDVFAVGTSGTVIHYQGGAWTRISPAWLSAEIETAWAPADGEHVYVAGTAGAVAVWERATGTWAPLTTGTMETLYSLWGSAETDLWAVGGNTGGTIFHYDGSVWTEYLDAPSLDRRGFLALSGTAANDILAVLHDGGIMRYDGSTWRPEEGAATVSLRGVWGVSPQDVFAIGAATSLNGTDGTALLRYDGTTWRLASWQTGFGARSVWAASADDVIAVAGDQRVRLYDGSSWTPLPIGFPDFAWLDTWGFSATQSFLVGGQTTAGGQPLLYQGAPGAWTAVIAPSLPDVDLLDVSGTTATDDVLAVGTGGTILRIHPSDWSVEQDPVPGAPTDTLRGAWAASATEAFAVGDNGTILHWDGTAWSSMTDPADPWVGYRLNAVWGSSPTNVFAAGEANTLLRYDGSSWQPILIDTITDFTGVWGSTANNVFLVSNDRSGKILHRCGPAW